MKKKKNKIRKRTIFTMLAMFNITWYTVVVLFAAFKDHVVQSDLTIAWFAAWTAELALLYGIKVHDKYTGDEDCDESDKEENNSTENSDKDCDCEDFPAPQDESFDESSDDIIV